MRFTALGDIGARSPDGASVAITGRSQRLIVAVLLADAGRVVPTDALVDALWEDEPPPTAVRTLRSYISRLRSVLGDVLAGRAGGYVLDVDVEATDVGHFEALLDRARDAAPADAVVLIDEALGLWHGRAYAELADAEALRHEARRLELRRVDAREELVEALLGARRPAEAAAAADALTAEEPLRETAWALLVEARTAAGAPGEALRAYQRAIAALAEAGLEPSPRLRSVESTALAAEPLPPPTEVAGPTGGFDGPSARTSLVGRDDDLLGVRGVLRDNALVTLVGPGGVGKTRLAIEVARRSSADHRFGARFVSLADLAEADAVGSAVADALGLVVEGGDLEDALRRAGDLDVLIVLDNCEHLLDAVVATVELLHAESTTLRVLATSRERLAADGEMVWPVSPLTLGNDRAARRLFRDRAQAVRPDLPDTPEAEAAIERIVRRVDGLPLAIEMAAAMAATTSLTELADTLERDLDVLRAPTRGAPARHRTLRSLVAWSEAGLDDGERALLAELSVFDGPVTADDALAALDRADDRAALRFLAERSLVAADVTGTRTRYRLPAVVRHHATELLTGAGRRAVIERRRAEHVLDAVRVADDAMRDNGERAAHDRFDELYAELRGAHRWAQAHEPALAAALTRHLHVWAASRYRAEPFRWAERLLTAGPAGLRGPAAALAVHAHGLVTSGRTDEGARAATTALDGAEGTDALVALEAAADAALFIGSLDVSLAHARDLRARAEALGDAHYRVLGACNAALALAYGDRPDAGAGELADLDVPGAPTDRGWIEYTRGEIVLDRDPPTALAHLRAAVELADAVDNRLLGGVARVSLCSLQGRVGDPTDAGATFVEVIDHWRTHGARTHLVTTLRNLVPLLQRIGEHRPAAEVLAAVTSDGEAPTFGAEGERLAQSAEDLRDRLGDREYETARRLGSKRELDHTIEVAFGALGRGAALRTDTFDWPVDQR
ncbi:MAG: BTAD domain-containing putative transcriptional regulator [Actinomycetota bacterium]|nr:BTAD domain-containing putative transcriptional regulator [Actinomycetota bacterium]